MAKPSPIDPSAAVRVLTVRYPKEEHAALRTEAWTAFLSMNKLARLKLAIPVEALIEAGLITSGELPNAR